MSVVPVSWDYDLTVPGRILSPVEGSRRGPWLRSTSMKCLQRVSTVTPTIGWARARGELVVGCTAQHRNVCAGRCWAASTLDSIRKLANGLEVDLSELLPVLQPQPDA